MPKSTFFLGKIKQYYSMRSIIATVMKKTSTDKIQWLNPNERTSVKTRGFSNYMSNLICSSPEQLKKKRGNHVKYSCNQRQQNSVSQHQSSMSESDQQQSLHQFQKQAHEPNLVHHASSPRASPSRTASNKFTVVISHNNSQSSLPFFSKKIKLHRRYILQMREEVCAKIHKIEKPHPQHSAPTHHYFSLKAIRKEITNSKENCT